MNDSTGRKPRRTGATTKPAAGDAPAVAAFVRAVGSVAFYVGDVPADFGSWRRAVRQAAQRLEMRVSVLRRGKTVWVLDPDYEPSADEMAAAAGVVGLVIDGEPTSHEQAVHDRRRSRMHVVRNATID